MIRYNTVPKSELLFLVVDDDQDARKIVVDYLRSFGYEKVIESSNGIDALSKLEHYEIDFVISDWEMPGLPGLELLRRMRREARWHAIPFLMITAPISHENLKIEQAAVCEVDAYLLKPFRSAALAEKLEEAIGERREAERRGALVVDDDPQVREMMKEMLAVQNFDPIWEAKDGDEAFVLLNLNAASLAIIVSDWEMPNLSGIELLRKIRTDRNLSHTPFLMVTSQTSLEHMKVQKAIESDVDHYLLKPFVYAEFEKKVTQVMARAKAERKVLKKLERAYKADRDGDPDTAGALYQQVLQLDPRNAEAYLGLAHLKIKTATVTGFDECIQMTKIVIRISPRLDRGYMALALAFEKGLSIEKAIESLKHGITQCPPSPELHFELGRLLFKIGKTRDAAPQLERAIALRPDYPEAKVLLSDVLARIDQGSGRGN
jgi:two-component system chemotaxis response regulator CheY